MHKESQEKNSANLAPWDLAISDAERKLKHTEVRSKRLRAAIETFKAHKEMGKPWPGQEKAGTEQESIPA